jgi:hypothetical protein
MMGQHRDAIDLIEIEVISADPEVFTDSPTRPVTRPRWLALAAVGAVLTLAVVAVAVLQPWHSPPNWRSYPVALRFPPSTTSRQVLGAPTGEALELQAPEAPLATAVTRSTLIGHVFAEPGADASTGRWAAFSALPSYAPPAPAGTAAVQVHGVDATLTGDGAHRTVTWGPRQRFTWSAESNGLTEDELLEFASAAGVQNLQPALRERHDLPGLEPVGGIEALRSVQAIERVLGNERVEYAPAPTVVRYAGPSRSTTLLSIPAPPDTLPLVPFVLGEGYDVAVHGQPGVVVTSREHGTVVAWMEGGRLFVVASELDRPDAVALAESTRPATEQEWAALETIQQTVSIGFDEDSVALDGRPGIDIGSGTTPSGSAWRVWAFAESDSIAFCLGTSRQQQCMVTDGDEQPPLDDWYVYGGHVSIRFGMASVPSVAIVLTDVGGAGQALVALPDGRSAIAVFVPEGADVTIRELQPSSSETPSD